MTAKYANDRERIARHVLVDDNGCWLWTGAVQSSGYGSVGRDGGTSALAHRVSYEAYIGPIPDGMQVDHVKDRGCRSRRCVAPYHLEAVTPQENVNRTGHGEQTHCKRNHPLSGDNLIVKKRGPGRRPTRNCRTCQVQAQRDFRARQRAA